MPSLCRRFAMLAGALLTVAVMSQALQAKEAAAGTSLELKDGWYYINGEKFFVNALGYEIGARPGQHPYVKRTSEPERVRNDIAAIKAAGFNAIRTWSELSEQELQVVQESGLKVIFGIGIDPAEDFSDPAVVERFLDITRKVLAYSRHYDCIITYLVMNEPMPQHIRKVGAQATVDLWTKIRDTIHREHPGIPVTITGNAAVTEFVDMNIFDVYAYNLYDYDGFNYTHGYANAAGILPGLNGQGKPLLLTEFGLSVSRDHGEDRYGGNTLQAQMQMLPWYYRQVLDAGAAGACPFYYADGWWKGEEPQVHNDTPEEWFGFWGYRDAKDTVGYPRPVWHAMKRYNKALISSPKNQTFYRNKVPVELFLQDDVDGVRVIYHDRIVWEKDGITDRHLTDMISFGKDALRDRELVFEFYDSKDQLLKLETIVILTGEEEVKWPTIRLTTPVETLKDGQHVKMTITLTNADVFSLADEVRYMYATHIGWSRGERRRWTIDTALKTQTMTDSYLLPDESPVLGLYAGVDIAYGKFVKTIHDEQLIYRGDWADPIKVPNDR